MKNTEVKIGAKVVRSKGDYVVGRIGSIIEIDEIKQRARVDWETSPCSWVKFEVIELEAIPHTFTEYEYDKRTGRQTWPKYIRL